MTRAGNKKGRVFRDPAFFVFTSVVERRNLCGPCAGTLNDKNDAPVQLGAGIVFRGIRHDQPVFAVTHGADLRGDVPRQEDVADGGSQ